jgi:medium-chain acyl-[acyl-carrier-protein] hydrolase
MKFAGGWIDVYTPRPLARMRLFCFPYAGGNAQVFREWADALPAWVDVCPIQPPGRWSRHAEAPFTRVSPLVEAAVRALLPFVDRPYALFGHSFGAVVAFETAHHLARENGVPPTHLFVSGAGAPHLPSAASPIRALPEKEFVSELCKRYGGIPQAVLEEPDLMEVLLPCLRADIEASETYQFRERQPLECAITAYGGLLDGTAPRERIEAWSAHTRGPFSLQMIPGDHLFVVSAQERLLRCVREQFRRMASCGSV